MQKQTIALENFEGPLDLLLYLVKKGELDIYEILLRQITNQLFEAQDIESLIPTASLLLMKSEALLPKRESQDEPEEPDPHFELIHHLADYCRFRHAAKGLVTLEAEQTDRFGKGAPEAIDPVPRTGLHHLSLADLSALFEGVMERAVKSRPGEIGREEWSVGEAMAELRTQEERIDFYTLFSADQPRGRLIVTFLALLELIKLGEISVIAEEEALYVKRN